MKEQFEEQLHRYNSVLEDLLDPENTSDDQARLEAELRREVKRASHDAQTTPDLERRIVELQRRKREVMNRLHEELRLIDDPDAEPSVPEGSHPVSLEDRGLMVEGKNRKLAAITHGELLTDMEWGIVYAPDASVLRDLRKRHAVETARAELRMLLDEQIILEESGSEATHFRKREAYQHIRERRERGDLPAGIIAEKMVRNFLKKLSIDTGVDFSVVDADVYQDVEKKIDFIIRRRSHHRGVRVEADEHAERVGVQMTTSSSPDLLAHKHQQVERSRQHLLSVDEVDDIVLVSVPLKNAAGLYEEWKNKKTPGGPDKLWDDATRETIFREVLAGVFKPEEIEDEWGRVTDAQKEAA